MYKTVFFVHTCTKKYTLIIVISAKSRVLPLFYWGEGTFTSRTSISAISSGLF